MIVAFNRPHEWRSCKWNKDQVADLPADLVMKFQDNNIVRLVRELQPADLVKVSREAWRQFREKCGVHPDPHVYYHSPRTFWNARIGDKALIIRKYGGLGDILICSYLLNVLHQHYPDVQLTFCTPVGYHELYQGIPWLKLLPYDKVSVANSKVRGGVIENAIAAKYDIVEDVSTPCHVHEQLFTLWDFGRGPLKWQNRMHMWLGSITPLGYSDVHAPQSCIRISAAEIKHARKMYFPEDAGKTALVAPVSALDSKNFPWHGDVCRLLDAGGYTVRLLGDEKKIKSPRAPVIYTRTFREFLAVLGAADLVVTVDSAALHGCGVMGRPGLGLFNINDGQEYVRYYPTVRPLQLCPTPCIMRDVHRCQKRAPDGSQNCYPPDSVRQVEKALRDGGWL